MSRAGGVDRLLDDKRKAPCCLMAAWGFALGRMPDQAVLIFSRKHPIKCILWRAAMLATFA